MVKSLVKQFSVLVQSLIFFSVVIAFAPLKAGINDQDCSCNYKQYPKNAKNRAHDGEDQF